MEKRREAIVADIEGINHIREACKWPPLFESQIKKSEKLVSFVTEDEDKDKILAYASLYSATSFQSDEFANLDIFVLPDNQRHSIGSNLIQYVFEFASSNTNLKRVIAGVSDKNQRAKEVKKFLRKMRFEDPYRCNNADCFEKKVTHSK